MGSLEVTKTWLYFANDSHYWSKEVFDGLNKKCDGLGAKIYKLNENWETL
jgi:23S rRNA-intervening sequence protein